MKRFIFGFLAIFFLIFNILPSVYLFADGSYSNTQYAQVGSLLFSNLITSGEATELDFSDYTGSGTDFLIALGEMAVTGDVTGLIDLGLDWLGDQADEIYENAIQGIREWEYNIAPDLYNWWYNGSQYEFKLEPVKASGLALRRLLTPPDDNSPTPSPDPYYNQYLEAMNGAGFDYYRNYYNYYYNNNGIRNLDGDITDYTLCYNMSVAPTLNNGDMTTFWGGQIYTSISNPLTVYIYSSGNTYSFSFTTNFKANALANYWDNVRQYNSGNGYIYQQTPVIRLSINGMTNYGNRTVSYSGTLENCFKLLAGHFKNINIYVDGVPWSLPFAVESTYPITIDDLLTVLNDQPAIYNYPDNTYIDLSNLQQIITDAIDNSDVLTYNDIKPVFVDVNGQEAVAVVQIYRNDYDNMYPEQLPLIILPDDDNYFSVHLLDTSKQYLQTQVDVVENTVDVLPSHLVGVLAIGCILTIFACIIHRLLE